jgi:hypothetical protein
MLSIYDSVSMDFALSCPLDPVLKKLLLRRLDMLSEFSDFDLSELAHFVIVEPGDTLATIEAELGFSPFINFVDGAKFGDADFTPSWEWLIAHGPWFECVFTRSDAGVGINLLVPNRADVEPELIALFNAYGTIT